MSNLINGLNIAKRGMDAHETRLEVAGHNITNASTEGYHKKQAVLSSTYYRGIDVGYGGVEAKSFSRYENKFLLGTLFKTISNSEGAGEASSLLGRIEEIIGEPGGVISTSVNDLLDAFNDLSINPTGNVERDAVVVSAKKLTVNLNNVSNSLTSYQIDIKNNLKEQVAEFNELLQSVKMTNKNLANDTPGSDTADHFEQKLRVLSKYVPLDVYNRSDGTVALTSSGLFLGDKDYAAEFHVDIDDNGFVHLYDSNNTELKPTAGKLAAILETHNKFINETQKNLDSLTQKLVTDINTVHKTGTNAYGVSGTNFFDPKGVTAKSISIERNILGSAKYIASSSDGSTAAKLASVQEEGTYQGALEKLVFDIGMQKKDADSYVEVYEAEVESLDNRFKSETGVDISEEVMDLVKEQRTYNACAQVFRTIQEMIDVVIHMAE